MLLSALCSEAREAFIKQFSFLEDSTGRLSAQLHDVASALNCSISTAEEEEPENGEDEGSRAVCQTFTDAALMMRASQKQLKQATVELDAMVGQSHTDSCDVILSPPNSERVDTVRNAIDFLSLLDFLFIVSVRGVAPLLKQPASRTALLSLSLALSP